MQQKLNCDSATHSSIRKRNGSLCHYFVIHPYIFHVLELLRRSALFFKGQELHVRTLNPLFVVTTASVYQQTLEDCAFISQHGSTVTHNNTLRTNVSVIPSTH
jgi:hypothetical protein